MLITFRLFKGTFKALYSNFNLFVRLSWAWLLLLFALATMAAVALGPSLRESEGSAIFFLIMGVSGLCANSSIAVGWHRCLLIKESPAFFHLRLGRRELAYIGRSFLLLAVMIATAVLAGLLLLLFDKVFLGDSEGNLLISLFILFGAFMGASYWLRLMLILPAFAVDAPISLTDAWQGGRRIGIPMLFASIALGIVVAAASFALQYLLEAEEVTEPLSGILAIQLGLLSAMLQILSLALAIGVISGGYFIMMEERGGKKFNQP